ncbi:hypothetical protein [Herbaspirillum seropedicae]|uniref:hypothetical protein n=1 Tax=Herbaspirillum seropedicae TaxID=964 RepID=UPI003FCE07E1
MDRSILGFLLPQWQAAGEGGLQLVFALLFVLALILMPWLVRRAATPAQWQQRWAALSADPQSLPSSITPEQLSQIVATGPERWARVVPGLLLMAGLLGTFIGLGLALGEASGALDGAQAPTALAAVLDTLGAKFRIAAWGILSYLILRLWWAASAHEQARLAWSAAALGALAAQAVQRQVQQEQAQQQRLIEAISHSGQALLAAQQAEAQRAHVRHAELVDALQRQVAR